MQRLLPPLLLVLTVVAMVFANQFQPMIGLIPEPWNWLGLAPLIIGFALAIAGARLFKSVDTNIMTFGTPDRLVTRGLFAHSRNPMYLGMALVVLGVATMLATVIPFLLAAGFWITLDRWYVRFEEEKMRETFGEDYAAYRDRVRRWI